MSSTRRRLLIALASVLVLVGGGVVVLTQADPEPVPVAAAEPPGTAATTRPAPPTTAAPYRSLVATALVPELEVFAAKPVAAAPEAPAASTPGAVPGSAPATPATVVPTTVVPTTVVPTTVAETTTTVAPRVAPIPRASLRSAGSRVTESGWAFTNPTQFASPLVLRVTELAGDWLRVEIPARPNGQEGWVRAGDVSVSESAFRLELTLSEFTLRAYEGDTLVVETPVVIGTDYTPTPVGTFYLGEVLSSQQARVGGPNGSYGPFVLATSAYSETLDLFGGGLPVIALHGTNQPGLVGTKASNGCVRMPNEVVTQLAEMVPAGSVVTVVP